MTSDKSAFWPHTRMSSKDVWRRFKQPLGKSPKIVWGKKTENTSE